MRDNGPVNDTEYVLPPDEVIITHTDPEGRITYANPAFLASSEFSLEECLGQPQNIIRHPDMPPEAFADLWATIKAGNSWTGIVKNRRKHGGFYWVRANITPRKDDHGRIVGYMSVRVKPTREEIATAERVYANYRAGRPGSIRIRQGKLVDTSIGGWQRRLANLSLRAGTWLFLGFTSALLAASAVFNHFSGGHWLVTCGTVIAGTIACANMLYVQGYVVRPLAALQQAALSLLSGDTTTRIHVEGTPCIRAVSERLEQVRVKLDGVLKDNILAAKQVSERVSEVVNANAELSNRTTEHAASLEQAAASMEELTAAVSRNTDSSRQAAELARDSAEATERGRDIVASVHSTMGAISESSKRIGEIVGIIDGIAFQTNLLALNAAVEAARAGDQGRGFAVVAQEVRQLAQRSATSAREIRELITASQQTVEQGSNLALEAQRSMQQVVDAVKRVAQVVADIQASSQEQAAGIEQVSSAVAHMDSMTQQDARMAQELMEAAAGLQAQSDQMMAAISAFSMRETIRMAQDRVASSSQRQAEADTTQHAQAA